MSFLKYLLASKGTRWQIALTAIIALAFTTLFIRDLSQSNSFAAMWQWMDPFLAISTVTLAAFIWHNEKKQDWENTLPKKLNIFFRLQGDEVNAIYEVRNAPLAGTGDIRQWGQQIGRQMNKGDLAFHGFNVSGPERDRDKSGSYVMRYELTIWLQTHDEGKPKKVWEYDDEGKLVSDGAALDGASAESPLRQSQAPRQSAVRS